MANLGSLIQSIRQAIKGIDVRKSIADGIEAINAEVETNTASVNEKLVVMEEKTTDAALQATYAKQQGDYAKNIYDNWKNTPIGQVDTKIGDMSQISETNLIAAITGDRIKTDNSIKKVSNIVENQYPMILEQSFQEIMDGRIVPLANTLVKNEAKSGVVTSGAIQITGPFANLLRVQNVKDGTNYLYENVDYTIDYTNYKIVFPMQEGTTSRIEETSLTFVGGNWFSYSNASFSGGGGKYIPKAGASSGNYVEFQFTGTNVYLITRTGTTEGIAKVTVDGGTPFNIDLYKVTGAMVQDKIPLALGLSNATHTVRIEHSGLSNASASGNCTVFIDAIDYSNSVQSQYETKTITYAIDYLKYQGALDGITAEEAEDKFRFKILYAPNYAYFASDKNKIKPFPLGQLSTATYSGSEFKRVTPSSGTPDKNYLRSGLKFFVKQNTSDTTTVAYTNFELENTPNKSFYENYGDLGTVTEYLLIKPCLVVVTDRCRATNFEVGEIALAIFTQYHKDTKMELTNSAVNLFKLNRKLYADLINVVAYGDSITACTYLPNYASYSEQAEILVRNAVNKNVNFINKGDNGDKTTDCVTTMNTQVLNQSPDYVIIALGTNDQGYAVPTSTYRDNLVTMINTFRAAGAKPLLMNMPYVDYPTHYSSNRNLDFAPYLQVLNDVSTQYTVPLIDINTRIKNEIQAGNWDLFAHYDGTAYNYINPRTNYLGFYTNIHLNIFGQAIAADEIAKTIAPLIA